MTVTTFSPIGASVSGLDLAALTDDDVDELRHLLAEHGAVAFSDTDLDDAGFVAFLGRFGPLTFTAGETEVEGHPDLNVVSNVGRTTPPRSRFHVDTSYVPHPPAYTALRAVTIPERGGDTLFTNQYRAYETLPADVKTRLEGRTVRHVMTGLTLSDDETTEAEHPVFVTHPLSGRTAIYLSTPARCVSVSGLDERESAEAVRALYEHSTREANVYRHAWSTGDVVMWDNRCVLHRADHSDVNGDRVLHRGLCLGDAAP